MSIRWKFLMVLMVFSLVPLLVFATLSQRVIRGLRENILEVMTYQRGVIIKKGLQDAAENFAGAIRHRKRILELALRNLVRDGEKLLATTFPGGPNASLDTPFDDPFGVSLQLAYSLRQKRLAARDRSEPMSVRPGHALFWLAPGVDKSLVAPDIALLAQLLPLENVLQSELEGVIYRLRVSLTAGVESAYPRRRDYPPNYDPINQPWYILARERNTLVWNTPDRDPFSGRTLMTVSMPLRLSDGSFAGVAAIDMLLFEALQMLEPSTQWSLFMRSFFVHSEFNAETDNLDFRIVAEKDFRQQSSTWIAALRQARLLSSNGKLMKRFAKEYATNESGFLDMPHHAVNSIWAYSHAGEDLGFILIVPAKIETLYLGRTMSTLFQWQWLDTMVASMAVIFILILTAFWRSGALIKPFLDMVEAMQGLSKGDFSARMRVGFGDERDLVANNFNEMVPQLEDRIRVHKALEVAQEVQQNLLPKGLPMVPGLDISAISVYCDETGGDYFDFFPCDDTNRTRLSVVVGDVTGHGIGAALLMATARAFIRGVSASSENLAECVSRVNNLLAADVGQTGNFMTLFFLELDANTRVVRWVRAGHDPALFLDPKTRHYQELGGPGIVLGVVNDFSFEEMERTIATSGTTIVIGTDGIWEAHNSNGEMFGKQRLFEIVNSSSSKRAAEISDAVLKELKDFRGTVDQEDDVTLVVIKVM